MSSRQESSRSGWLQSFLSDRKSRIAGIFGELAGLGVPGLMKPAIFRKFLALLSQLDAERGEEERILSEIEAVELKHRFRREHNGLERADPAFEPECAAYPGADEEFDEKKKHRKGLKWFFGFLGKPGGHDNCHRKQDLT